jgi:hypothetical protein
MLAVAGPLRAAHVGKRYVDRFRASGGTPPYRLSVKGLPAPLRMRPDGTIFGKPKAPGAFPLDVEVVDAAGIRNDGTVLLKILRR